MSQTFVVEVYTVRLAHVVCLYIETSQYVTYQHVYNTIGFAETICHQLFPAG